MTGPRLDALPPERAALARETLAFADGFWDPDRGLVSAPPGAGEGDVHLVPQSGWYAYGLLLRGEEGDIERAQQCIGAVLELQYEEPGTAWDGTFARFAETPQPTGDAVPWVDYDPNWRQFLGTTFSVLLQDFASLLPADLVSRIHTALRRAVTGELPDRVHASYTNIALMKAWLEVEVGQRTDDPSLVAAGEALADEITRGFEKLGAFPEYNSATYYGIDFYALALWRTRSSSRRLRDSGAAIEAALWHDLARWFHPGLGNLCGPYSRTYGMDLHAYVGLLSLVLWSGLGRAAAPMPPLDRDADHGHDLMLGPLLAVLPPAIPDAARAGLEHFSGVHTVRQPVSDEPRRVATGWLAPDVMIGAEHADSSPLAAWAQYVAATLHWRAPDGSVCWLTVRTLGASQAEAQPGRLVLDWPPAPGELRVTVGCRSATREDFGERSWTLAGRTFQIETDAFGPEVTLHPGGARLVYTRADPDRPARWIASTT